MNLITYIYVYVFLYLEIFFTTHVVFGLKFQYICIRIYIYNVSTIIISKIYSRGYVHDANSHLSSSL